MLLYVYVWNGNKPNPFSFFVYFILDSFEMCINFLDFFVLCFLYYVNFVK